MGSGTGHNETGLKKVCVFPHKGAVVHAVSIPKVSFCPVTRTGALGRKRSVLVSLGRGFNAKTRRGKDAKKESFQRLGVGKSICFDGLKLYVDLRRPRE